VGKKKGARGGNYLQLITLWSAGGGKEEEEGALIAREGGGATFQPRSDLGKVNRRRRIGTAAREVERRRGRFGCSAQYRGRGAGDHGALRWRKRGAEGVSRRADSAPRQEREERPCRVVKRNGTGGDYGIRRGEERKEGDRK